MIKTRLSDIQTVLENESRYAALLAEGFVNPTSYKEQIVSLEHALRISNMSADILMPFRSSNGFFISLPYTLNESTILALAQDPKMIVPLYLALRKLRLNELAEHEVFHATIDRGLAELYDRIKDAHVQLDTIDFETFKGKMGQYKLAPTLLKAVHGAVLTARCEFLVGDLIKDIEQKTFKRIQDLLNIPVVYLRYLSDGSVMRLVKAIISRLEDTERLTADDIKELDMFSARVKEQLKNLYNEANKELRESVLGEIGTTGGPEILLRISTLFTRLQRMLLGHLFHIGDYLERRKRNELVMEDIVKLRTVSAEQFRKMFPVSPAVSINELYDETIFFLNYGDLSKDEWKTYADTLMRNIEACFKKSKSDPGLREELSCLGSYEKRGVFGGDLNVETFYKNYFDFFRNEVNPIILGHRIFNLLDIWPPREYQKKKFKTSDLVNFGAVVLNKAKILYPAGDVRQIEVENGPALSRFLKNYYRTVTVLCYDIRGSTYMGGRLQNAEKERKIKYKFSLEMSGIVRKYGGFLLKDTGDGGIAWFGDNSKTLYERSYTESVTGKGFKLRYSIFSGGEFELLPADDSAKRAILCALDMVKKAEEFIKANFVHYREWFGELKEREVKVEGITYALLPPAFRSLFRIGVGIASGMPGRDVVFGLNSFGDPDLVGPLLSDANFFSMGKEPSRSVILTDMNSVINLIANIEHFDLIPIKSDQDFVALTDMVAKVRSDDRGYLLNDLLFSLKKLGTYCIADDKERAVAYELPRNLELDEHGNLFDEHGKKLKLLFEVVPHGVK